jgi:HlyD family secretion protein
MYAGWLSGDQEERAMNRRSGAAALAVLALAGCGRRSDPSSIVASGHVEATDVRIATKVAGRLGSLALQEGDAVKAGQELARVETTDLLLAVRQARAERDQAAAEYQLRLAGARKEDIAELEAQVASVQADLENAQKDFERMQGLLDKGSGTTKARDDAKARRDMTAHRLEAVKQALARMRAGSRPEEKEAARARLAAMDARIAQLEHQLEDATIKSPLAGIVTEKVAEPGELLQVGSPLCVITDLANAWLTVYVGGPDLGRIRLGQEAEVTTDDGQTRKGKVTFVASQAEFTPKNVQTRDERVKLVYKVKVSLDNQDGLFKPGMPAEARLRAVGAGQ